MILHPVSTIENWMVSSQSRLLQRFLFLESGCDARINEMLTFGPEA